ncbi:thiamine phosphate synthase [Alkalicoccus halolimnae]|uniref:Thiamine-phosphate synthase n=1 Tax=Alkalicoccus halolimnae TaxID=1667239 RepID=A0A5C7F688_9BACI|nr:thiamine phosphate synthase [Alkalicoccus halolimnae]TXF85080.1 thiamine phosphate synthase [Alkalicoccus halolimnae]
MKFTPPQLSVYFIAGTQDVSRPLREVLVEAAIGGITMFQLREKGSGSIQEEDKRLALALELKQVCHEYGIPFIVNDDVELALASGADGLHVGQEDLQAADARSKIGSSLILGVSAYTSEEAEQAVRDGADYIGVGPMYATRSKEDAKAVVGPERIEEMRRNGITIPITAIGGIAAEHVKTIISSGAEGVSVISAITAAESPEKAAAAFLAEIQKAAM